METSIKKNFKIPLVIKAHIVFIYTISILGIFFTTIFFFGNWNGIGNITEIKVLNHSLIYIKLILTILFFLFLIYYSWSLSKQKKRAIYTGFLVLSIITFFSGLAVFSLFKNENNSIISNEIKLYITIILIFIFLLSLDTFTLLFGYLKRIKEGNDTNFSTKSQTKSIYISLGISLLVFYIFYFFYYLQDLPLKKDIPESFFDTKLQSIEVKDEDNGYKKIIDKYCKTESKYIYCNFLNISGEKNNDIDKIFEYSSYFLDYSGDTANINQINISNIFELDPVYKSLNDKKDNLGVEKRIEYLNSPQGKEYLLNIPFDKKYKNIYSSVYENINTLYKDIQPYKYFKETLTDNNIIKTNHLIFTNQFITIVIRNFFENGENQKSILLRTKIYLINKKFLEGDVGLYRKIAALGSLDINLNLMDYIISNYKLTLTHKNLLIKIISKDLKTKDELDYGFKREYHSINDLAKQLYNINIPILFDGNELKLINKNLAYYAISEDQKYLYSFVKKIDSKNTVFHKNHFSRETLHTASFPIVLSSYINVAQNIENHKLEILKKLKAN